ncbi:hypothetical protein C8F01DRAFT_697011 [Mycena amicta]|nr:hypothetical protein C8F01DRAFT_697011 [Mycena amicta]
MTDTDRSLPFNASSSIVSYSSGDWFPIDSDSGGAYETEDVNATATFTFDGTFISVLGTIHSSSSSASALPLTYVLDGEDDHTFLYNASSPSIYASPTRLSSGSHTLAIRLASPNATLSILGGSTTSVDVGSQQHRTIAIIAIAASLGGVILLTVICVGLFVWYRYRRQRHSPTLYALGPLQANLPLSKEAFTSPKYSNYGISFSQSTDEVNVLPAVPHVSVRVAGGGTPPAPPRSKRNLNLVGQGRVATTERTRSLKDKDAG